MQWDTILHLSVYHPCFTNRCETFLGVTCFISVVGFIGRTYSPVAQLRCHVIVNMTIKSGPWISVIIDGPFLWHRHGNNTDSSFFWRGDRTGGGGRRLGMDNLSDVTLIRSDLAVKPASTSIVVSRAGPQEWAGSGDGGKQSKAVWAQTPIHISFKFNSSRV